MWTVTKGTICNNVCVDGVGVEGGSGGMGRGIGVEGGDVRVFHNWFTFFTLLKLGVVEVCILSVLLVCLSDHC